MAKTAWGAAPAPIQVGTSAVQAQGPPGQVLLRTGCRAWGLSTSPSALRSATMTLRSPGSLRVLFLPPSTPLSLPLLPHPVISQRWDLI